jgi:hypothetical protein
MCEINKAFPSLYLLDAFFHVYLMQRNKQNFLCYCINRHSIKLSLLTDRNCVHVLAKISYYQVNSVCLLIPSTVNITHLSVQSIEQTAKLSTGSKNNLSEKPKTENSPGRISVSSVVWSSSSLLGSTVETHYIDWYNEM